MRKSLPIFWMSLAVLLAGACIWEGVVIARLQDQVKAAQIEATEVKATQAAVQREVVRLQEHNEVFKQESEVLRQKLARIDPAAVSARKNSAEMVVVKEGEAPPAIAEKDGAKQANGKSANPFRKWLEDPNMREMMAKQQRIAMRTMYGEFGREAGLSADEMDQLEEAVAARNMKMMEKNAWQPGGSVTKALADAGKDDLNAAIKKVLGPERYKQYEAYERTVGERVTLQQYEQQFIADGRALQPDQRKALIGIMVEERERSAAEAKGITSRPLNGPPSDEYIHEFVSNQADVNRRVLDRARGVLSQEEIAVFERGQKQLLEMQTMGMKMSRSFMQSK